MSPFYPYLPSACYNAIRMLYELTFQNVVLNLSHFSSHPQASVVFIAEKGSSYKFWFCSTGTLCICEQESGYLCVSVSIWANTVTLIFHHRRLRRKCLDYQCICFMPFFYNCQHLEFVFLDGLALGSSQMGRNEYIQLLLLLEKEWNPSPKNNIIKKNVNPARSTRALVSHSFLLAWLKKWCEGQVKILSRNWRGTVTFMLASQLDPSMQSHLLWKDFTLGPASLPLAWPGDGLILKALAAASCGFAWHRDCCWWLSDICWELCSQGGSSNEECWQIHGTQRCMVPWPTGRWHNSEKTTAWLPCSLCTCDIRRR